MVTCYLKSLPFVPLFAKLIFKYFVWFGQYE